MKRNKTNIISHSINATKYSYGGFMRLLKENSFRYEVYIGSLTLILLSLIGASATEILTMSFIIALVFAFEAINTAIEEIIDHISPEYSELGKNAKDMGSFAVFCLLISSLVYISTIILKYL